LKTLLEHIRLLWQRLLELRDTPHAIAGGVGIGVFYGFTPLFGIKTLLSLGTAWLARCSKLAAVITVSLHDVVAPLWPVLLRVEYQIGFWILSNPHHLPQKLKIHDAKLSEMFHWAAFHKIGLPILIGSIVIAVPSALVCYAVAYWIARRRPFRPLPPTS
jgi:uncharacterized protein (DUF2062 family)